MLHQPGAGVSASRDLPVWKYLQVLHERHLPARGGALASYIPELAAVDPDQFGISIVTTDGFVYEVGDSRAPFTIQSISKAIIYGLALQDHGQDEVLRRIGVEPSGDAFNSITFDERSNRPYNPMVNAGAIAASSMIVGDSHAHRYQRIIEIFRKFTGRALDLDEQVYRSESLTGNRNRAIAYLALNSGMISGNVEEHLDLYFRQCSLLVTTRDLAVIGATLANGGINPVTGERALDAPYVRCLLSVMNSCGMYDYAGGWQFDIGLPAKSGVGGGITAVLPGQLGIGVFSPRLDEVGNSARGVKVCQDISAKFRLHLFEDRGGGLPPFRRIYRSDEIRSKRIRRQEEARMLGRFGHRILVYELQAELDFIEAERISRRLIQDQESTTYFVLDLTRVVRIDAIAFDILKAARDTVTEAGKKVAIVTTSAEIPEAFAQRHFPAIDVALEYFENQLLADVGLNAGEAGIPIERFDLLAQMPEKMVAALRESLDIRAFCEGEKLVAQNSSALELFFLTSGRVDVRVRVSTTQSHRVGTIDAGNIFGELALLSDAPRTADVVAATAGEVMVLGAKAIARLRAEQPEIVTALLTAVARSLADRLRRANEEIRVLSR